MTHYRSVSGVSAIVDRFDTFLIDQFGVIHDGDRPYPGALDCLRKLKALNKEVVLLSNSGKRSGANVERLLRLGFARECFDHVVTSGDVAWHCILNRTLGGPFSPSSKIFLVGHDDYDYGFEALDLTRIEDPTNADFIIIAASQAPRTSLAEYGERLLAAAAANIPALCCNPDRMMLTQSGLQPSAGEIALLYERFGGKVAYIGKPYLEMYRYASKTVARKTLARGLAIGDSIEHDIGGGHKAGLTTLLVRTGISGNLSNQRLNEEMHRHGAFPVLPQL
ncbi:TIGR01459 family HAD-type hydrolase [Bradyrhizobium sp. BR13661]|jgi:HAD superfamily hydrolase (TIGR01459 family)|uniref:TIGR01459 family HAD-type hydrolase n=1 Tax=Bradyrhizobium sp. BR13661 TaxID=2940622 RepID=UPI0024757F0A|nr:TIGR01459 family HAD-type hydrolase [Bradyrhizobium sp. BR13661]MDH6257549.1 HAD superfamily hydrolase (TIGR01459 family) [Bradyrhizobium sp. BR13661]